MRALLISPCVLVALAAGCAPSGGGNTATDINAAAARGQADVNGYAAVNGDPVSAPSPAALPTAEAPLTPAEPGQPGGLPDDGTPVSEAPFTPDSAQGAANVVQTYYALIGEKKYRQAWALWDRGGQASGQSPAQFAASFGAYREYHANVGAPGRIDAGAGQRYVTVPVQPYARRADGSVAYWRGNVTLHRAGDIDGATAEQRSWRIQSIDLKPAPGGGSAQAGGGPGASGGGDPMPAIVAARYRCMDGTRMTVRFDNRADTATIRRDGGVLPTLSGRRPASGIWYANDGYELRGKGNAATLTVPGRPPIACTAIG